MLVQIAIAGQYFENYGAHDWDGTGECPQFWKAKFEDELLMVCNVPVDQLPFVVAEMQERMDALSYSTEFSRCWFDRVKVYPNKMSLNDASAFDYGFYEDVRSVTKAEIDAFVAEQPRFKLVLAGEQEFVEPEPLPYEEFMSHEGF